MAREACGFYSCTDLSCRFIETSIGESLQARKDALPTFRDLGPPDLAHGIRSNGSREV